MRRLLAVFCAVTCLALLPSTVSGQVEREGFFIGFGLGLGSLGFEDAPDRETAPIAFLRLGGALNDKVLLGAESNAWVKNESEGGVDATLTSTALSAVVYFYPNPDSGFYLKGGLGIATLDVEVSFGGLSGNEAETGSALTLGFGSDIGSGGRFAFSPFANLIYSTFEGGTTNVVEFGLGFNWY